jgi:selenium metabolism protein YedF
LQVLVDNETSLKNVSRFLQDHGLKIQVNSHKDFYEILVVKKGTSFETSDIAEYCDKGSKNTDHFVIVIQTDHLGEGPEELGKILMKGFINTLPETEHCPSSILFMNSGIHLALKDSPVINALQKMEEKNTEILVCGTCLDYFSKKEELGVGRVSNIFEIMEKMFAAEKVVYP